MVQQDKQQYVTLSPEFAELLRSVDEGDVLGFAVSAVSPGKGAKKTRPRVALEKALPKLEATFETLSTADAARQRKRVEFKDRIFPVVPFYPQYVSFPQGAITDGKGKKSKVTASPSAASATASSGSAAPALTVLVTDAKGKALKDVIVTAYASANRLNPVSARTDANGMAVISIKGRTIAEVWAFPDHTHWSKVFQSVKSGSHLHFKLEKYETSVGIALDILKLGKAVKLGKGKGVKVAVIDTGVGPHRDIKLAGAHAVVLGRPDSAAVRDSRNHGTHVAGIIGASSATASGMQGVAPECEIYSYRVFPMDGGAATNADVAAAIFRAIDDGCHVINLSLSSPKAEYVVTNALKAAEQNGVMVVAAAGNHGAKKIAFPASEVTVVSVAAMGCSTTFPADSQHAFQTSTPAGKIPSHFIASFSNAGKNLLCSSVGVAVISTVPGNKYYAMDGTSMAAPAVCGIAACLLSATRNRKILKMPADANRSAAMRGLLYTSCNTLGFALSREGTRGLPS
jgi:subtilisin